MPPGSKLPHSVTRESQELRRVNHKDRRGAADNPFTPRPTLSSNGTEGASTGIWRPFQGNIVVNALAHKEIFCIPIDSQMWPPVILL
jgi:hypothetical protein